MNRYLNRSLQFISHLLLTLKNNSQSSTQTKIEQFYCTKFVIALVKDLAGEMQECTTEFSK